MDIKLHHGKLKLDTKNSLSENVRCQTKFPWDNVEFPGRIFKKRTLFILGGDSDVALLEGRLEPGMKFIKLPMSNSDDSEGSLALGHLLIQMASCTEHWGAGWERMCVPG